VAISEGRDVARAEREVVFQQDLCFQLQGLISDRPSIRTVRFEEARMEFPAGAGRADIAVLRVGGDPFLVIETKRKGGRVSTDIDPWDPHVIQQAIGYAALVGAPYFATANRGYLAAFRTPNRGEKFEIPSHRVFATAIQSVDRKFVSDLLIRLVDYELATTESDRAQIATALDWTFVYRLRSFVDWLSRRAEPAVRQLFAGSPEFADRLQRFEKERGTQLSAKRLAREMVYVLANKILFYKALERRFKALDKLDLTGARDIAEIQERLASAFKEATVVTHDFEAIFSTDLYDDIALEATPGELTPLVEGLQGFIDDMQDYQLEKLESDIIGYVYENLIPEVERHELGQFYTPPAVAELIVRWSIHSAEDRIFDPSAGSGTFLVKAYQRLRELKLRGGLKVSPAKLHRDLLSQLYSNDLDPFAVHLTAMNLALRDVRHPVTEVNIYETDFFHLAAGSVLAGESEGRPKRVPQVQVVLGNPPYTRWLELPDTTREAVGRQLNKTLRKYGMVAQIRGGVETAVYQHFVIHGASFVAETGRLGMIISNSWLQTEVGIKFGAFLLDNFKVHAVIDFSSRLFEVPLVATTVILLEKCSNGNARDATRTVFARVSESVEVDELLSMVKTPGDFSARAEVHVVEQRDLRMVGKWIGAFFGFARLDKKIREKTVPLKDLFRVTRGTIRYAAEQKRGLGANNFFYLDQEQVEQRAVSDFTYPTLPGARGLDHFVFSESDWKGLNVGGKEVY
jgi:type I restriction-modification system DNA methylase subunit